MNRGPHSRKLDGGIVCVVCSGDTHSLVQINGTETKDSELDIHKYTRIIFNKGAKAMQWKKIAFSINGAGAMEVGGGRGGG